MLTRFLVGTTAPLSGLIALTRETVQDARSRYAPIGSLFALELLIKTAGRRVEVPILMDDRGPRARIRLDEVRHLKRLADARFGNASRLVQFCMVGASGMVVDLTCYALFQLVFSRTTLAGLRTPVVGGSLDLAAAGALAIVLALTWNFSLNRRLTFNDARQGSIVRQYLTYALSNALGIALSFSLRLMLPSRIEFFAHHRLAAAVVGIVGATGISFSMSRWLVFSRRPASHAAVRREPETAECDPRTTSSPHGRTTRRPAESVTASK
jgi:dolichol-phosphate mannosyltransferase